MYNIKVKVTKWHNLTRKGSQWIQPFQSIINGISCYGYLYFRHTSTPPTFVVNFENKLIRKHERYKNIRSNILAEYKEQFHTNPHWLDESIKSFERANVK
jgi:hypothetical protein